MRGAATKPERRVLLIQKEPEFGNTLRYSFEVAGYLVDLATTGEDALRLFSDRAPDLVLLDVELADMSGYEVCRRMRAHASHQPAIIIVTARNQEADRVAGFEAGADDYVVKPFSLSELMLRIQARLLGRLGKEKPAPIPSPSQDLPAGQNITVGPLEIEQASCRVFLSNREISLSAQEMRLLIYLANAPGKMRTRRELFTAVWGYHPEATSRTLDTHVKRLRDKFGALAGMIQTVHGVGYRLSPQPIHASRPSGASPPAHRRR